MKRLHVLAVVALLTAGPTSAGAQGVTLEFHDGKVRLNAQNVPVSQILSEWARRGRTTIVNGERLPGPSVTLELQDVPEQDALDIVLRSASGYLVAARETAVTGASSYDRIYILPTSSRPTTTAAAPQQPTQALQVQDDFEDEEPGQGPRGPNFPPGARLPRDVGPAGSVPPGMPNPPIPGQARPPIPSDDEFRSGPQNQPGPPVTSPNPFGVAPGTTRPGVINPAPTPPNAPPNP